LAVDLVTLFKFVMFMAAAASSILFSIVVGLSSVSLIVCKPRPTVPPSASLEGLMRTFIIVAFVLKLLDVLYTVLVQTSYDIFFIDWERPRLTDLKATDYKPAPPINSLTRRATELSSTRATATEAQEDGVGAAEQSGPQLLTSSNGVSCWRTLFVANEWNELQTYRRINPTVQLVLVLLILKVFDLEALAACENNECSDDQQFNIFYRVGVACLVYLSVG
jgi:meckelin